MRDRSLSRLFARYRDRGDLEALEQVFEATAPALLSLGTHLTGHAQDAEDVLQGTYLTAIEQRDQFDATRPLEPWLFGILVRLTHRSRSQSSRTLDPDRLHSRSVEDPSTPAAESELQQSLLTAIEDLPDSYRAVLDPYLKSDERPRDIAGRLGTSPGTIRVRIHRGLALLRKALPAGLALGSAGAVASTSIHLAKVREAILARAGALAPTPVSSWSLAGMSSTLALRSTAAAAVVAIAIFSVWKVTRSGPGDATLDASLNPRAVDAPSLAESIELEGPASAEARLPVLSDPDSGAESPGSAPNTWTLTLRVTGFAGPAGTPLSLRVEAEDSETRLDEITLEADGSLERRIPAPPESSDGTVPGWTLRLDHIAYAPVRLGLEASHLVGERHLEVEVPLARQLARITGRVDPPQGPSTGVGIFELPADLEPGDAPWLQLRSQGTPDESGTFEVFFEPVVGACVVAQAGALPSAEPLEEGSPWEIDLGRVELEACHRIEGAAYDRGEVSEAPGTVTARCIAADGHPKGRIGEVSFAFVDGAVMPFESTATTDSDGRFVLDGLARGDHAVLYVPPIRTSGFYNPVTDGTRVTAPATGVVLDTPIRIYTIEVRSKDGPVPHATVLYSLPGGSSVSAPTDVDGRHGFYYAATSPPIPIVVSKPGYRSLERTLGPGDFGADLLLELSLEQLEPPAKLTMNLVPQNGAPFGAATLRLRLQDSSWWIYHPVSPGASRIEFPEVPAGTYELSIDPEVAPGLPPEQQARWTPTTFQGECVSGEDAVWEVSLSPGGRMQFILGDVDPTETSGWSLSQGGRYVPTHFLVARGDRTGVDTVYVPDELPAGSTPWLLAPLPPGEVTIRLSHGDRRIEHSVPIVAGDVSDVQLERR